VFRVVLTEAPNRFIQAELDGRVEVRVVAPDASNLAPLLATADAVLVRLFRVTGETLRQAPNLKVIGRHGVGYDTIDIAAATARGIPVVYTPSANSESVAEHCLLLMLAVARRLVHLDQSVRAGGWEAARDWSRAPIAAELEGKTLGIIGLGEIGRRVAVLAAAFGMRLIGHDPLLAPARFPPLVDRVERLPDLLSRADIVTLHAPLTPETRHLIDSEGLRQLKAGAILINTARGPLIDEAALAAALEEGRLGGAGLDVLEEEPPAPGHPLLRADRMRLTLTPHVAGVSETSLRRMAELVCGGILAVLEGEQPPNVVNPEVWSTRSTSRPAR